MLSIYINAFFFQHFFLSVDISFKRILRFSLQDKKQDMLRAMVKTLVLKQDWPLNKKTGGLFMYLFPTLKYGFLFV